MSHERLLAIRTGGERKELHKVGPEMLFIDEFAGWAENLPVKNRKLAECAHSILKTVAGLCMGCSDACVILRVERWTGNGAATDGDLRLKYLARKSAEDLHAFGLKWQHVSI